jgi:hypothetical protein
VKKTSLNLTINEDFVRMSSKVENKDIDDYLN